MWYVYIIETITNKLYTGITKDIERRFFEHAGDLAKGAKFTKANPPKDLVFLEVHEDRSSASKREAQIKKLTKQKKIELINGPYNQLK